MENDTFSLMFKHINVLFCRQKLTQDYSHQVLSVLQQWETDVQKSEEQEEKLNVETFSQSCKS